MRDIEQLLRNALGLQPPGGQPRLIAETSVAFLDDGVVLRDYTIQLRSGRKCGLTVAHPAVQRFFVPVIAAHQTNHAGRAEVFGRSEDPSLGYGLMLARRGHKVYGMDLYWTSDRDPSAHWDLNGFRASHPEWSPLGVDCQDFEDLICLMRDAFDEPLPFNWIGHSHGAVNGYVLAAMQPAGTFAGLVCNAGFAGFLDDGAVRRQIYLERYFNARHSSEVLLVLDEVIALACDKAKLRLNCYREDEALGCPLPTATQTTRLGKVQPCQLELAVYDGAHTFPPHAQVSAALFLERQSSSRTQETRPYLPWLGTGGIDGDVRSKAPPGLSARLRIQSFGGIGINTTEHGVAILSALLEAGLPPAFLLVSAETDEQLAACAPFFGRADWVSALACADLSGVTGPNSLAGLASAAGIPTLFVPGLSSPVAVELARAVQVDAILLLETPLLRGDILQVAKAGLINFHAAPLPCYRGSNATLWALYHDEPLEVWAHFVEAGVDTGALISCLPLPVYRSDTIDTLATRACQVSASLAVRLILRARGDGMLVATPDVRRAERFRGAMPAAVLEACKSRLALGQYSFYAET